MATMKRTIRIVDSTLRDGQQSPGLVFSLETRARMTRALDDLGVARIEALSPGMLPGEREAAAGLSPGLKNASLVAWSRLRTEDVSESVNSGAKVIHVCFPTSEAQLSRKLRISFEEAAGRLAECVGLVRDRGLGLSVGLEDVSRASPLQAERALLLLKRLGVSHVRLSDTVGVLTPGGTGSLVKLFASEGLEVEFHAHNDLGMADANSLVAALSGAGWIDVTMGGVGERAGNASLSGVIRLIELSGRLTTGLDLKKALLIERTFAPALIRNEYLEGLLGSGTSDVTDSVPTRGAELT